jgi:LysR family glycine cleavage system transcriptional activator
VEAAVRNRSYSAAARELQITHAAISQAIKRLEAECGLKLFERNGQAMEPSPVAVRMAHAYSEARNSIYRSLGDIIERPAPLHATIAMSADFSRFWFAPRIDALTRDLPSLAVDIRTGGIGEEDANIGIGFEPVDRPGWSSERVADMLLFPVCSPAFAVRQGRLQLKQLPRLPLLAERRWSWRAWLESAGLKRARVNHDFQFNDANVTLDAAVRGHGVALAHIFHVEQHLRQGSLVAPMHDAVAMGEGLHLSWRSSPDPRMDRLVAWLRRSLQASAKAVVTALPGA